MEFFKKLNICDFYVGLWGLYCLQGMLYPQGIINQLVQLLMTLLGLGAFVKCSCLHTCALVRCVMVLTFMYTIYGALIIMFGDGVSWTADSTYLKNSFNSLLPVLLFYYQTRAGKLNCNRIKIYVFYLTVVVIMLDTYYGKQILLENDVEEITNNISYMFVGLIPMVFFLGKKPIIQYLLLALLMYYTIMGMKRGAVIIGAIAVFIFIFSGFSNTSKKKRIIALLLSIAIVIGTIYLVQYLIESSAIFMHRVNETVEGNTSQRDRLYRIIWDSIRNENNVFYLLFGHGANSTVRFAGNFAHQDWLETLCNNGLIGGVILFVFFITFAKKVKDSWKFFPSHMSFCFFTLFIITFTKTMFSMSIQNMDVYQSMLLGYFAYWSSPDGINKIITISPRL